MFEYAISEGEGTLVAHGVMHDGLIDLGIMNMIHPGCTIIVAPCADDCETGQ
jgi:hypothetical protein